jgi:hypothetical protein
LAAVSLKPRFNGCAVAMPAAVWTNAKNFIRMSKCALLLRHSYEAIGTFRWLNKDKKEGNIMKYAMLVYQSQETFDRRDDAAIAAGRAYGEALQAAGVFVGGAGLDSPQAATRNGGSMTALMSRRKNFLADSASSMCPIWIPHWSGSLAIPRRLIRRSRFVR